MLCIFEECPVTDCDSFRFDSRLLYREAKMLLVLFDLPVFC